MEDSSVFIFCSGKATRLKPLSYLIPKPVLPWTKDKKSMLELNIERFSKLGFKNFYITYSKKRSLFEKIIKKYSKDLNISLIYEKEPVGQIKSVRDLGSELTKFKYTICQNGDTFSNFDLDPLLNEIREENIGCVLASSPDIKDLASTIVSQRDGTVVGTDSGSRRKLFYDYKGETFLTNYIGTLILKNKHIQTLNDDTFIGIFGSHDLLEQLTEKNLYAKCLDVKCKSFYSFNTYKEYFNIKGQENNV